MKKLASVLVVGIYLLIAAFGSVQPESVSSAVTLSPLSIVTLKGTTDGAPVGNLDVLDQTGTDDDPGKYVTFMTPAINYKGYRRYFLLYAVNRSAVSALPI